MRLAEMLAARYDSTDHDARNEAYLALVIAARRFDSERGAKFSTYAYRAITNRLLNLRRTPIPAQVDWNALQAEMPTESSYSASEFYKLLRSISDNGFALTVEDRDIFGRVLRLLNQQESGLILLLLFGYTQSEIARMWQVSQATISRRVADVGKKVQGVFSDREPARV